MTEFQIPLAAQAALNRRHREGVPVVQPGTAQELARALYHREREEGLVVRAFSVLLDATLIETGPAPVSLSAASPSNRSGHSEGRETA